MITAWKLANTVLFSTASLFIPTIYPKHPLIALTRDTLSLQNWDTFWLSDTPSTASRYPDACCNRIATLAKFSTSSGTHFTLICTHWDNYSDAQRRLAASLILYRGAYEAATTGRPVFVLGDFNSPSVGADSGGFQIITGQIDPVEIETKFRETYKIENGTSAGFVFQDVIAATPPERRSGHHATFTGFRPPGNSCEFQRIDFIMGGSNGGW